MSKDKPEEISAELSNDVFAQNILTLFDKAGRKLYNMARARRAKIKSIPKLKGVYGMVKC